MQKFFHKKGIEIKGSLRTVTRQDEVAHAGICLHYNRAISLRREVIEANERIVYRLKLDAKPCSVFRVQVAFHRVDDLGEKK